MGLFDKIRDSISGDDKPKKYQVVFVEDKMGMTLAAGHKGEAVVTAVIPGGAAAKANVRANDVVEAVNGNPSPNYSGLIAVIGGVGRPVEIAFYRPGTSSDGGKPSGTGREPGPLQAAQDAARRKINRMTGPPQPPPMTAEEKADRREVALKAAESRTKVWDKRLNKGRQASQAKTAGQEVPDNQFEASQSAETRRMVDLARKQESRTAASMGYNPYQARMMGNTAARSAITGNGDSGAGAPLQDPQPSSEAATPAAAPDAAAATGGQRLGGSEDSEKAKVVDKWFGEDVAIAEGYGGEIETALGVVLEQGPAVSMTAVQTMLKMLKNMAAKSSEDKFKRIRLANANFHSKVGGVDGALDVMVSAGFELQTDNDEAVLQYGSCDPVPLRLSVAVKKLEQVEAMLKDSGARRG